MNHLKYNDMYNFVKFRDKQSTSGGFWVFCPNSIYQIKEHFDKYVHNVIRESSRAYSRHILYNEDYSHDTTVIGRSAYAIEHYARTHDCIAALAPSGFWGMVWESRCETFIDRGEVFLAEGPQVYLPDTRFVEQVDEILKDTLDYPREQQYTIDDVRFTKWGENTKHWYARLGTCEDVRDKEGNMKWDTREEAEIAAKWYINQKH